MGIVNDINQESVVGVITAAKLYELDAIFTVHDIKNVPSSYGGTQWKLTIRLRDVGVEDAELPAPSEDGSYVTYLSGGNRDVAMEKLIKWMSSNGHIYNCYIDSIDTGKPNPYYSLQDLNSDDLRYVEPPKWKPPTKTVRGSVSPTRTNNHQFKSPRAQKKDVDVEDEIARVASGDDPFLPDFPPDTP